MTDQATKLLAGVLPPCAALDIRPRALTYAIALDRDIESLRMNDGDPYNNAYTDVRKLLPSRGCNWQRGSVYFGGEHIHALTWVLAAIDLAQRLPRFAASVRDIRMLRIDELNDLRPAVPQGSQP